MPLIEERVAPQPASVQSRGSWLAWSAAGLFFVIAGATLPIALMHLREQTPAVEPVRFEIQAPPKTNFGNLLALSPNGRLLAFTATGSEGATRIWVRDLDKLEARPLVGTENAISIICPQIAVSSRLAPAISSRRAIFPVARP